MIKPGSHHCMVAVRTCSSSWVRLAEAAWNWSRHSVDRNWIISLQNSFDSEVERDGQWHTKSQASAHETDQSEYRCTLSDSNIRHTKFQWPLFSQADATHQRHTASMHHEQAPSIALAANSAPAHTQTCIHLMSCGLCTLYSMLPHQ